MKMHVMRHLPGLSPWDEVAGQGGAGAGGAPPPLDEPPIDETVLARLQELDPSGQQGVLRRVLTAYRQSLERHLDELSVALDGSDRVALLRASHTLKSSSAAVGALVFSQRCGELEAACRDGESPPSAGQVEALIHEGRRVMRAVGAMLDR